MVYYGDTEAFKLTDGQTGGEEDLKYASPVWVGLNVNGKDANNVKFKTTIVVDLEKVEEEICKVSLYALEGVKAGIGSPKSVEVFISDDNQVFRSTGMLTQKKILSNQDIAEESTEESFAIYEYSAELSEGINARYVKFEITHSLNWAFISEVQVFKDLNKPTKAEIYKDTAVSDKLERYNTKTILDQISLAFLKSNSLEGLYDIIRDYSSTAVAKNDTRSCVMYKGDGYNYLVVFDNGGVAEAFVEDYRDQTFTLYTFYNYGLNASFSHARYSLNGPFLVGDFTYNKSNYEDFRKKLDSSATSEKTLERFNFLTTESAFLDFAEFYTGDTLDSEKIFQYIYSPEHIMKILNVGYVFDLKKQSNVGYDILDNALFKELLDLSFRQDLKDNKELTPKLTYSKTSTADNVDYAIRCSTYIEKNDSYDYYFEFEVGVADDGQKYIRYLSKYAYIDDASYQRICEICDTLWHNYTDNFGVINF